MWEIHSFVNTDFIRCDYGPGTTCSHLALQSQAFQLFSGPIYQGKNPETLISEVTCYKIVAGKAGCFVGLQHTGSYSNDYPKIKICYHSIKTQKILELKKIII